MKSIFALMYVLLTAQSYAAVHYVSQSDTGSHFTSIGAGIAFADSGDTVCVYPGTYAESSEVVISKPLSLLARGYAVLDNQDRLPPCIRITADSVVMRNFSFINNSGHYPGNESDLIVLDSVSYCILDSITVENVYLGGITLYGSDYNTISNCTFNNIGDTDFAAVGQQISILLSNSQSNLVENTRILQNTGAGKSGSYVLGGVYIATPCTGIMLQCGAVGNSIRKSAIIYNRGMRLCLSPGGCTTTSGTGIKILDSSSCIIDSCDIYGNSTLGIDNTSRYPVNTSAVWWGSWHGPRTVDDTASNPYYQETVSGDISYAPWAIAPYFPDLWDSLNPLLPGETGIDAPIPGNAERITISPMPFKNSLRIQSKIPAAGTRLPVYDRVGRMVTAITVPRTTTDELHWDGTRSDGTTLPAGMYFIGIGGTFQKIIRSE